MSIFWLKCLYHALRGPQWIKSRHNYSQPIFISVIYIDISHSFLGHGVDCISEPSVNSNMQKIILSQNKVQQNTAQASAWFHAWLMSNIPNTWSKCPNNKSTKSQHTVSFYFIFTRLKKSISVSNPLKTTHYIRLSVYIAAHDTQCNLSQFQWEIK